jgi:profilin
LSPTEIQEVITGLSGKPDKLYADGFHVAGERYVLTKAEDRSLYARKVGFYIFSPHFHLPPSIL